MFYCGFLQYISTVAEFAYLVGIILQILTVTDSTLRTGYKNYKKNFEERFIDTNKLSTAFQFLHYTSEFDINGTKLL